MNPNRQRLVDRLNEIISNDPECNSAEVARNIVEQGHHEGYSWHQVKRTLYQLKKNGGVTDWQLRYEQKDKHPVLEAYQAQHGTVPDNVPHYWHKVKLEDGSSVSAFVKQTTSQIKDALLEIVEELPERIIPSPEVTPVTDTPRALRAVITDAHVGMNTNPENALFRYEYNEEIFRKNLDHVYQSLHKEYLLYGSFDVVILDDLGDALDGYDGQTTRGGHALPQNMSNKDVFKAYVYGKLDLIEKVIQSGFASKIVVRSVTNDNHAGDFGYIANAALQMIIERSYPEVEIVVLERFLEHFTYGDHCYILTHGKDKKEKKFGLPMVLNDKAVRFVNDYIDHYNIDSKYIHLDKGDLHQIGYQRTKKFDYRNYMSFAPPSSWVQHNFGDTYSGYSVQVIPKYGADIAHTDYFFEMKKAI